jgi:hypothetical protein
VYSLSSIFITRCGPILPPSSVYPTISLKKIITHFLLYLEPFHKRLQVATCDGNTSSSSYSIARLTISLRISLHNFLEDFYKGAFLI